ncbi:hypothetical protein D3C72_2281940 [compost metagenome]
MGILHVAGITVGDAHHPEHFQTLAARLVGGQPAVLHQAFFNLAADPHRRVQGGHGVLENHADIPAADRLHLMGRLVGKVLALK